MLQGEHTDVYCVIASGKIEISTKSDATSAPKLVCGIFEKSLRHTHTSDLFLELAPRLAMLRCSTHRDRSYSFAYQSDIF